MADSTLGLRPSKKFATGSVHEVGGGKFEILDRFMENNVIYLKYKWLTGDNEGKIETNKEQNINANLWKFQNLRGNKNKPSNTTPQEHEAIMERLETIEEKLFSLPADELLEYFDKIDEHLTESFNSRKRFEEKMLAIHEHSVKILEQCLSLAQKMDLAMTEIHQLNSKYELTNKLIDKI